MCLNSYYYSRQLSSRRLTVCWGPVSAEGLAHGIRSWTGGGRAARSGEPRHPQRSPGLLPWLMKQIAARWPVFHCFIVTFTRLHSHSFPSVIPIILCYSRFCIVHNVFMLISFHWMVLLPDPTLHSLFSCTFILGLSRGHSPPGAGLRALLRGPTAARILLWLRRGLNHQPSWSLSCTLVMYLTCCNSHLSFNFSLFFFPKANTLPYEYKTIVSLVQGCHVP